jgi:hypothetical protein
MWLTGRLTPDFKTIADFRKDNGPAIRAVCRRFVQVCRELGLLSEAAAVAIDGSKFKAVNTRDKNFTPAKVQRRMEQVDAAIARYLAAMDAADRQEGEAARGKSARLKDKIASLRQQMQCLRAMEQRVRAAPDQQVSLTDPDARSMATSGKGTGVVGYNVQAAVDAKHHLIVAHEVTNEGHDRAQLANMAGQAQEATGRPPGPDRPGRPRLLRRRGSPRLRAGRRRAVCAQAADLGRQGRGAVRQAGLRLPA